MRKVCGLMIVLAIASGAMAGELWDNDLEPNGFSARAISPPGFPAIRVADDFTVPDGERWSLEDIHYTAAEDGGWLWADGDGITVEVWEDTNGNGPGDMIASRNPGGSKMDQNRQLFGRELYDYWAEFENDPIELGAGTYWISVRHPTGGGAGTNYWPSSDGGPDGAGSSTGWFSLDNGNTWAAEGVDWHHTFVLTGVVPEPTSLVLLTLGGLALLRRRR